MKNIKKKRKKKKCLNKLPALTEARIHSTTNQHFPFVSAFDLHFLQNKTLQQVKWLIHSSFNVQYFKTCVSMVFYESYNVYLESYSN